MSELTSLQRKSIEQFRHENPQYTLYTDEALISVMKEKMEASGVIYKGFESLAPQNGLKPSVGQVFGGGGILIALLLQVLRHKNNLNFG